MLHPFYFRAKLESIREQHPLGSGSAGAVSPIKPQSGPGSPLCRVPVSPSAIAFAIGQEKASLPGPLTILSFALQLDEIDRELCSPQHVEMHTFRDAIDVNYQRMGLTGEELSGVHILNTNA